MFFYNKITNRYNSLETFLRRTENLYEGEANTMYDIHTEKMKKPKAKPLSKSLLFPNLIEEITLPYKIIDATTEAFATERKMERAIRKKNQEFFNKMRQEAINKKVKETVILVENNLSSIRETFRRFIGQNVVVEYIVDGKSAFSRLFTVEDNFSSWWRKNSQYFAIDSENYIFTEGNGKIYMYPENKTITTKKIVQAFRDGISHCLLTPIREWAEECKNNAVSKSAISRYETILADLDRYDVLYAKGVPEDKLPEICNRLQINISIELPFKNDTFGKLLECKSIKKSLKNFKYMNTRVNHVELNELISTDYYIDVTQQELLELKHTLDEQNEFYTYTKNFKNISSISTFEGIYKVNEDDYGKAVAEFEKETGLIHCKIDDMTDGELSYFVRNGTHYNATVDGYDISKKENCFHIDMRKAYANFQSCKYYEGFLGKITDFRATDKIVGVGLYLITNLNFNKSIILFNDHNCLLEIYKDNNIYTSAELKMLTHYGVTYKIVAGCWGVKPLNFTFTEDMMNGKDHNGVAYYAKWTGQCDSHNMYKNFWMQANEEFVSVVKQHYDDKAIKYFHNGELCVSFPKKSNFHLTHVTAFITAYQRMNVIEQLMEIEVDNIVRVCVDGIYHTQDDVKLKNVFRHKDDRNFNNDAGDSYVNNIFDNKVEYAYGEKRDHYRKELHIGAGGNGKTHRNLTDEGLCRILYCAPSWKLARKKSNEYNIHTNVWARVITDDVERVNEIKQFYNVIVFDEVSMMSENQKNTVFNLYGNMKLIFCGDLGYQLPCIESTPMNTSGFDAIVKNDVNYRCKDIQLKNILDDLRLCIMEDLHKNEINRIVIDKFRNLGRVINVDGMKKLYTINDMILAGTNEIKNTYTDMFRGKFEEEKYYVLENNRMYSNGDIVISKQPLTNCRNEVRHCFTVHSIQGETAEHRLFIDAKRMFDSCMFYTAISRAKTLDQIYIVE
jgi:hypothetical protein